MEQSLFTYYLEHDEPYAAGMFEFPEADRQIRYANAQKRFWEYSELTPYDGGQLYPCGVCTVRGRYGVHPFYPYTFNLDYARLAEKCGEEAADRMQQEWDMVPRPVSIHNVGGCGWTHSHLSYSRIVREGLGEYRRRVAALPEGDFRRAMEITLEGISVYRDRCIETVKAGGGPEKLAEALRHTEEVPTNIYEALVLWNFVFYLDTCDDIGRPDQDLYPFWKGEDCVELLHEFFVHADVNDAWSGALGPKCNELTVQCIRASHYLHRPSLQLRLTKDTPEEVWQATYESLGSSCGQPALYNEDLFQQQLALRCPEVTPEDRERLAFGGCTETMIEGLSNVGSDDMGFHTAYVYDNFTRAHLGEYDSFEAYYAGLCEECRRQIAAMLDMANEYRERRGKYRPQPIRTLFIDDCLDRMQDYNAGGARYYWSVSNISGFVNVVDSLCVIRELVFEKKLYTAESFHAAMDARDPKFLGRARACPCFGVDDDRCDILAADFANILYDAFDQRECWPRGRFFPVSNQFTTFRWAGMDVRATPDGRADKAPLCDSLGSVHGKDTAGPTAMLNSAAKLPLYKVLGTPVQNLRMKKEHLTSMLRPLVEAYFAQGGMQLQISVLSREEMLDAQIHPEDHRNLIVRIGGYSEYFVRLDRITQDTVLARTEY